MRFGTFVLALLLPAPLLAGSPLAKFGWFEGVVGSCWVGTFPDGKTQHSHCYTSQFPARLAYRSVWRRIDAQSFEVRREVPQGDGWRTELTVRYRKGPLK